MYLVSCPQYTGGVQDDIKIYLKRKAEELDLGRADALGQIQQILDAKYPGKAKAKSLNGGVLKVVTTSAAVASELRLGQATLVPKFIQVTTRPIDRLHIQITNF